MRMLLNDDPSYCPDEEYEDDDIWDDEEDDIWDDEEDEGDYDAD